MFDLLGQGGVMSTTRFFDTPEQQSVIKTQLVTKYFGAWSNIMLPRARGAPPRIAYVDLFSGPGRFADGTDSTPLWVLKHAIDDSRLRAHLVTVFNDRNPAFVEQLRAAIHALPRIETLSYEPEVENIQVGLELVDVLKGIRSIPTLFFIDPWGYRGLSLDLIGGAIRN
jgi:three-Cys-motif partner protein